MNPFDLIAPFYDIEHEGFTDDTTMYTRLIAGYGQCAAFSPETLCTQGGDVIGDQDSTPPPESMHGRLSALILGVGTGRVAKPLAQSGIEVWGVDASVEMLSRAHAKLGNDAGIHLIEADIADFSLDQKFDFVLLPFDTFTMLATQGQQLDVLHLCREHLAAGGRVVVDVVNPLVLPSSEQSGLRRSRFDATAGGIRISVSDSVEVDAADQTMLLRIDYHRPDSAAPNRTEVELQVRWIYRYELEALMRIANLDLLAVYGDYNFSEYQEESPRLIMVATGSTRPEG